MKDKARLFIAIPLDGKVREELVMIQQSFGKHKKLRPVPGKNLHITTCFLGDVHTSEITSLEHELNRICAATESFRMDFDRLCFMPVRISRMIWAKYKESDDFTRLSMQLGKVFIPEKNIRQKPVPHITLARFKHLKYHERPVLQKDFKTGPVRATRLCLYKSILTPEGANYIKLFGASFK